MCQEYSWWFMLVGGLCTTNQEDGTRSGRVCVGRRVFPPAPGTLHLWQAVDSTLPLFDQLLPFFF